MTPNSDNHSDAEKIKRERGSSVTKYLKIAIGALALLLTQFGKRVGEAASEKSQERADEHLIAAATNKMARYTRWLVAVTALSVATAIFTADILWNQLNAAKVEARPWVGLTEITPSKDGTFNVVALSNSGKLPAMNVRMVIGGGVGDCSKYTIPHKPCSNAECTFRDVEMLPNVPLGARVPRIEQQVAKPGGEICLFARADYRDPEGNPHKTGLCFIQSRAGQRTCSENSSNYAD